MSSWWGGDDSGSDSDLYESDEEMTITSKKKPERHVRTFTLDDSSSDEEGGRRVRSKKESRFEDFRKSLALIENKRRNNDWLTISEEWSSMEKNFAKSRAVLEAEGWPKFIVAGIAALEDQLVKMNEDKTLKKSMKPQNYKSYTRMKQTIKKFLKEHSDLEAKIGEYRLNPHGDSDDEVKEEKTPKGWLDLDDDFDEDDDEDDDEEDEDEDDYDSSEDDVYIMGQKRDISYWFAPDKEKSSKKKDKPKVKETKKKEEEADASKEEDGEDKKEDKNEKPEEWNQEKVDKKIKELLARRGTKGYDRKEQLKTLSFLLTKAEGIQNILAIKFHMVNAYFDELPVGKTHYLPLASWKIIYNLIVEIIRTLLENRQVALLESDEELTQVLGEIEKRLPPTATYGHLQFALERMSEEYLKSMQDIESHSQAYIQRLAHEKDLLLLLQYGQSYYKATGNIARETAIAFCQLEHLYYKKQSDLEALVLPASDAPLDEDSATNLSDDVSELPVPVTDDDAGAADQIALEKLPSSIQSYQNITEAVETLARLVYRASVVDRAKRTAMLQHIYHLALNDHYWQARDMLLMSHMQEKISREKSPGQVLFNRTVVQLGLAAFRLGRTKDAHSALAEIASSGRTKELLAQGLSRQMGERNPEQEAEEQRRQVPYHKHINLDLIETAHLISALLLEVPNIAHGRHRLVTSTHRKILPISKHFRRLLDIHDRQIFSGPPENTREKVIHASRYLFQGDWKKSWEVITALDAWALIPQAKEVQALYEVQLKEAGLKTFLFTNLAYYKSLTLETVAGMFDLDKDAAHAVISRMIGLGELAAGWDQINGTLSIHSGHQEPSTLQSFILQFAERANALLDLDNWADQQRQGGQRSHQPQPHQQTAWVEQRPGQGPQRQATYAPRSERQLKGVIDRKQRNQQQGGSFRPAKR